MKSLLEGKRVFKQEADETKYLFLPEKEIEKYYYFYHDILIKKGDLLFPTRWMKKEGAVLAPLDSINLEEYEYVFFPEWVAKYIKEILAPFMDIEIDNQLTELLALEELPVETEKGLRELIEAEHSLPPIVEAYKDIDKEKHVILHQDFTKDDISDEYTSDFSKINITSTYEKTFNGVTEIVLQTNPNKENSGYFSYGAQWFHYQDNPRNNVITLTEIHDMEEILLIAGFKENQNS